MQLVFLGKNCDCSCLFSVLSYVLNGASTFHFSFPPRRILFHSHPWYGCYCRSLWLQQEQRLQSFTLLVARETARSLWSMCRLRTSTSCDIINRFGSHTCSRSLYPPHSSFSPSFLPLTQGGMDGKEEDSRCRPDAPDVEVKRRTLLNFR